MGLCKKESKQKLNLSIQFCFECVVLPIKTLNEKQRMIYHLRGYAYVIHIFFIEDKMSSKTVRERYNQTPPGHH